MRPELCLLILAFAGSAVGVALPSFIKACSESDPKLNECITNTIIETAPIFAAGLPDLGTASLDPAKLGTININNPALNIVFKDTVVTGLKGAKINGYKLNPQKKKAVFDFTTNITLKCDYNMDGQILILPIRGDGPAKIKLTNLNIIIKYDYETVDNHWVIKDYKNTYKMDRAQFNFKNLFGGKNPQLAKTVHVVVNESWDTIMKDIAPEAIEQIITACVNEVKKLFALLPASELLLP